MRRGQRRRDQRGAAAVEAALIMPIVFAVAFGIIEMGFLMRDHVAVTSMVRNGARIASASPAAGSADCNVRANPTLPCAPESAPMLAQLAADAVQKSGSAMPMSQVREIWIFKADPDNVPGNADDVPGVCTTESSCVSFKWIAGATPDQGRFRYDGGGWDESTITSCATRGDRVGVRLTARHPSATGLWGGLDLEDVAIMTFEPEPVTSCQGKAKP